MNSGRGTRPHHNIKYLPFPGKVFNSIAPRVCEGSIETEGLRITFYSSAHRKRRSGILTSLCVVRRVFCPSLGNTYRRREFYAAANTHNWRTYKPHYCICKIDHCDKQLRKYTARSRGRSVGHTSSLLHSLAAYARLLSILQPFEKVLSNFVIVLVRCRQVPVTR